jgi:hypothetical protein
VSAKKTESKVKAGRKAPQRPGAAKAKAGAKVGASKPAEKPTATQRARDRLRQAGERGLWVAAAYSDLARVLAALERLPKLAPAVAYREGPAAGRAARGTAAALGQRH